MISLTVSEKESNVKGFDRVCRTNAHCHTETQFFIYENKMRSKAIRSLLIHIGT